MYTGDFETSGPELLEVWSLADQYGVTNALKTIPVLLDLAELDLGPSHHSRFAFPLILFYYSLTLLAQVHLLPFPFPLQFFIKSLRHLLFHLWLHISS